MLEAIFTIIGTVIGAILGFLLSEWAQSRREEREEKRLAKAVQVLISVEIDTNLKKLKDFWSDVNDPDGLTEKEDIRKIEVARRLIESPFPQISRAGLESQLPQLPRGLTESVLSKILQVYGCMATLQILRDTLTIAAHEQKADWDLVSQGRGIAPVSAFFSLPRRFDSSAPTILDEWETIVNQLLLDGNPLNIKID